MHENPNRERTLGERLLVRFAWVWLLLMLPFVTNATLNLCVTFPLILFGFVLAIFWLAMTAAKPSRCSLRTGKRWLSVPLIGLLAMSSALTYWGLAFRVMLCETQLRIAGDDAKTKEWHENFIPRGIGLFHVDRIETAGDAVYYHTSRDFINSAGIAYAPNGQQENSSHRLTQHLYGPWYRFWWKF